MAAQCTGSDESQWLPDSVLSPSDLASFIKIKEYLYQVSDGT